MGRMVGVIGYVARDIVFRTDAESIQQDLTEGHITYAPGGTAVNVAAWLTLLGNPVEFVGMAGSDSLAESLIAELRSFGLNLTLTRTGRTPVIVSAVLRSGDRRLLVDNGGPFDNSLFSQPRTSLEWVHIPGHVLMRKDLSTQCIALLRALPGVARLSVDVCSESRLANFGVDNFLKLLSTLGIHVVFMNGPEAVAFGSQKVVQDMAPIVVIHNGPEASKLWSFGDWSNVADGIDSDLIAKDATGAGDAFAAGFIAEYLRSEAAGAAVVAGHRVAQRAVTLIGGNPL